MHLRGVNESHFLLQAGLTEHNALIEARRYEEIEDVISKTNTALK